MLVWQNPIFVATSAGRDRIVMRITRTPRIGKLIEAGSNWQRAGAASLRFRLKLEWRTPLLTSLSEHVPACWRLPRAAFPKIALNGLTKPLVGHNLGLPAKQLFRQRIGRRTAVRTSGHLGIKFYSGRVTCVAEDFLCRVDNLNALHSSELDGRIILILFSWQDHASRFNLCHLLR